MNDAIESLISKVIEREGSYVNHPNDHGGPTNWGITQGTLSAWRKQPVTAFQVQTLSQTEARHIYRDQYFRGLEDVTDPQVLEFLFDYAVNSGPKRAVKALQTILGVMPDGEFGPISKAALAKVDQATLYPFLICERLDNYMRIMARDPSQVVFGEGWANRVKPFWKRAA
jgi:lysozyme family protein